MRNLIFVICMMISSCIAFAKPSTIVFDYGDVLVTADRSKIIDFLKDSFKVNEEEVEKAIAESRKVRQCGGLEFGFWQEYGDKQGVDLPDNWMREFSRVKMSSIKLDSEVVSIIEQLKKGGYKVALLSNVDPYRFKIVNELGHYEFFEPVILSCDFGIRKPDIRLFQILFDKLEQKGEDCLFIDNKKQNVVVGRKLGMDGIVFESASQLKEELIKRSILQGDINS
ncbi:MAG: HAD-IA family hydrolase [Rhabdochlamydiaceae bacterium]|nr:HAD-IA family hydrolase [Candidatus Amphrikana amoebophyrae]